METGALGEDAFRPGVSAWSAATSEPRHPTSEPQYASAQERPWDAPQVSGGGLSGQPAGGVRPQPPRDAYEGSTASLELPAASATRAPTMMRAPTQTEASLGSVLVEGSLLTPNKLETLRGIQAMLASVNMPRKLGELAVMFKFLSPDQLLAALLVSRGLVSPQQIASLGRVKQELAATGMENDLETLLVRFNMIPADQLHHLRQELAS
jgi:hypothetical protein